MKINKSIISIFALMFFSVNTYAQQVEQKPSTPEIKEFTQNEIYELDKSLIEQNYVTFYDLISNEKISPQVKIKYLQSKRFDGHPPSYWVMANLYSQINNERETHKWLYVATITTQQDAALCYDDTSRFASQTLLRAFPNAPDTARKTPQHINSVMPEVVFFVENLKNRVDPSWACKFGVNPVNKNSNILVPKSTWNDSRETILKRYTKDYNR